MTSTEEGKILLLRQKIGRDPATAFRVLSAIWDRQGEGEKFTHQYDPREGGKGEGFNPYDTPDANALYERFVAAGKMWQKMSAIDVERCQHMMAKYSRQYLSAQVDERDRDIQRFKINKHPPRPKLSPDERQRIVDNVDRMAKRHNV